MRVLIRIELKRAFYNRLFLLSLFIGSVISLSQFFQYVLPYANFLDEMLKINKPMTYPGSLFSIWIGGNSYTMQSFLYYLLVPILATLPFADSFFTDKKSGFLKNVFLRTKKKNYYTAKFIATFTAGGAAVVVPLLLNFGLCAMIVPSMLPEVASGSDFPRAYSMWGEMYYTHPFLYVFSYLIIDFIFSGLIATIALVISFFVEYRFIVSIAPFLIYLFIFSLFNLFGKPELEPINFLQPSYGDSTIIIILMEILFLGVTTAVLFLAKGIKNETY